MTDASSGVPAVDRSYRSIKEIYTLFSRIAIFRDGTGSLYADQLWAIDLLEHLKYIPNLRLCCPVRDGDVPPPDFMSLKGLSAANIIPLQEDRGWVSVLANLIPNFFAVLAATRKTQIAHGGLAGWAFPLDYYLLILRPFLTFRWILNMESSFWMMQRGVRPTIGQWLSHHIHLRLGRACMRAADVRLFTQSWYRDMLLDGETSRTLINEASWVDEKDLLTPDRLRDIQGGRNGPVRVIMPTRLIREKGIATLLEAVEEIEHRSAGRSGEPLLIIDIVGSGPMADEIEAFRKDHRGGVAVQLNFIAPVPYGPEFFSLLSRYDVALVANLKEEQPRIIFDVFSQGLPCIASQTSGVMQIIPDTDAALLFTPGSAKMLADRLLEIVGARDRLAEMGARALAFAEDYTHQAMHRKRAQFLIENLDMA